jgi:serine protease Do
MHLKVTFAGLILFFFTIFLETNAQEYINDGAFLNNLHKYYMQNGDSASKKQIATFHECLGNTSTDIAIPKQKKNKKLNSSAFYDEYKSSVLIIGRIYLCNKCPDKHVGTASAFPITDDGVCVTNYHVFNLPAEELKNTFMMMVMDYDQNIYTIDTILAASEKDDIVIFKISTGTKKLHPLALTTVSNVGESVRLISHPQKRFFRLSEGIIARKFIDNKTRTPRIALTTDYATGSSGAPILNSRGQVISVVSTTTTLNNNGYAQMIEHETIPAASILKLLSK